MGRLVQLEAQGQRVALAAQEAQGQEVDPYQREVTEPFLHGTRARQRGSHAQRSSITVPTHRRIAAAMAR